jgi:hypothetical protein
MNIIAVGGPFKYGYQIPTIWKVAGNGTNQIPTIKDGYWKVIGKGTKIVFIPFR